MNPQQTDGEWLEAITVAVAPYIREWDIESAWRWNEWLHRETLFPNTTKRDVGIDVVAVRRGDGRLVAIQCKARQLDENGRGSSIGSGEIAKFAFVSSGEDWAEHWDSDERG